MTGQRAARYRLLAIEIRSAASGMQTGSSPYTLERMADHLDLPELKPIKKSG
jgi:hypothetical protein